MSLFAAISLFVAVDEFTAAKHVDVLSEWADTVKSEGHFNIVAWEVVPRASVLGDERYPLVMQLMNRLRIVRPQAVQIFGAVARPATGGGSPDGHPDSWSVYWGDMPYSCWMFTGWTDAQNRNTNASTLRRNVAGDNRWDQQYVPLTYYRTVSARVTFDGLTGVNSQPFTNNCWQGRPIPPLDEDILFQSYMRRNLEYRRRGYPATALWSSDRPTAVKDYNYFTNALRLPWTYVDKGVFDFGGRMSRHAFVGWIPSALVNAFNSDCQWPDICCLWTYKSYGWYTAEDPALTRLLQVSLVTGWGGDYFVPSANSNTVYDDILASNMLQTITGVGMLNTVLGDLTISYLPLAPNNLTVTK